MASESGFVLAGDTGGSMNVLIDAHVDQEWSVGDYVLSGGELPAMVMMDAVIRLCPACWACGFRRTGFVWGWSAGLSALHATRRDRRSHGAGGVEIRQPRVDTPLAPAAGTGADMAAPTGSPGEPSAEQ